uniref:Cytochrome P450 2K1-like n=1 Tax=Oryzias melastigma TaxID=30732 RepID=A0A3B3BU19_ORYME
MIQYIFRFIPASVSLVWVIVSVSVLLFLYVQLSVLSRREPPGPRPLPLLGNLFQVDLKRLDQSLFDLSKKYGPVFLVSFGPKKVVVLAGYRTVKQALVNQANEFGNREVTPIFYDFNKEHGILFANGDSWKEMRRFTLSTLRDFGMGKSISEQRIIEECGWLIEEFDQFQGKPFDDTHTISYAVSNVLSVFEWRKTLMKNMEDGKADLGKIITELKDTLDSDTCRCFVDVFLTQKQNLKGNNHTHYHDDNLLYTVMNLFAAGTDTTATTINWCLLFMAKYPHIQERVQEELNQVVGSRQVRIEDRKNLPFTDAVIHESQRLANIAPMAIPHTTSKDVIFQGYFIKKGTTVLPLLTSVLYDESEWESPRTFNPSHFLDKEGKFIKRDAFMPFSAGRRVCLGESLARMDIFLFFTSLLQHFSFTPPAGISEDELDLTPVVGFTLAPQPQGLCAVRRQ